MKILSINTQRIGIYIHLLPTVNYLPSPRRNSPPHSSHQYCGNFQRLFINNPKIFKDFFACKISPANHQYPGNIQRLSGQQQQQSAAATSSSNRQQQSTAAISSSNQQKQPAATTSNSNQHSSYQQHLRNQRRLPLVITTVPSRGYPASSSRRTSCPVSECNHRTAAHFCDFSIFLKSFF